MITKQTTFPSFFCSRSTFLDADLGEARKLVKERQDNDEAVV
jgi:hypothetical protein